MATKLFEGRGGWQYQLGRSGIIVTNPNTGKKTVLSPELLTRNSPDSDRKQMAEAIINELVGTYGDEVSEQMMDKNFGMGLDFNDVKSVVVASKPTTMRFDPVEVKASVPSGLPSVHDLDYSDPRMQRWFETTFAAGPGSGPVKTESPLPVLDTVDLPLGSNAGGEQDAELRGLKQAPPKEVKTDTVNPSKQESNLTTKVEELSRKFDDLLSRLSPDKVAPGTQDMNPAHWRS